MKPFKSKKHKKKVNHLIFFTTDAADSKVSQIRLTPFWFKTLIFVVCILVGVLVGYIIYGGSFYQQYLEKEKETKAVIATLEEEKKLMTAKNEELSEKVAILSETVNQKVQEEEAEAALLEKMCLPTDFPLTGSAQVVETTTKAARAADLEAAGIEIRDFDETDELAEDDWPICIFTASDGTTAVASGNGSVVEVSDDVDYGHKIVLDHGNGYQSIYLNKGEPTVKVGDSVNRGVTLYVIGSDNTTLGYQITENGEYINPMDIISISG